MAKKNAKFRKKRAPKKKVKNEKKPSQLKPHSTKYMGFKEANRKDQIRMYRSARRCLDDPNLSERDQEEYTKRIDLYQAHWEELRKEARDNPDYFVLPSLEAWSGDGHFPAERLRAEGALLLFGYTVNQEDNLSQKERQNRLDDVFETVIPPFGDSPNLNEWGDPETGVRLKKMMNCIAAFVRNATLRRDANLSLAIERWTEDFMYLGVKYYTNKFNFDVPSLLEEIKRETV